MPHPPPVDAAPGKPSPGSEVKAELVPELDCKFFHTLCTERPEWIVEHEDGSLESSAGGKISAEDLVLIEQTADCESTSQGGHKKQLCDAQKIGEGVEFSIYGGAPAYIGILTVRLKPDRTFTCTYDAAYKSPPRPLEYRFKKQTLRLKSDKLEPRSRLYAWISVELDEIDLKTGKAFPIKLEGYIKPVIKSPVEAE